MIAGGCLDDLRNNYAHNNSIRGLNDQFFGGDTLKLKTVLVVSLLYIVVWFYCQLRDRGPNLNL